MTVRRKKNLCLLIFLSALLILSASACKLLKSPLIKSPDAFPPGYYNDDPLPEKTAYLTFDDGPSDWTAAILDILKKNEVKATFFICGDWAPKSDRVNNDFKKYRTEILRMIREDHIIGNHTIDHKNLATLAPEKIRQQFIENQELLNREIGEDAPLMTILRPPFGSPWHSGKSKKEMVKVGKAVRSIGVVAMWTTHFDSSDSREWVRGEWYENGPRIHIGDREYKEKMQRIYQRTVKRAKGNGIVILFHDTHPTTKDILPLIIDDLKKKGYMFNTMEDLIQWKYKKSSMEIVGEMQNQ